MRVPAALLTVLVLAAAAVAEDARRLLREAEAEAQRVVEGESFGGRMDRAIAKAAEAARADGNCADAFVLMGVFRLEFVLRMPDRIAETVHRMKAGAASNEEIDAVKRHGALEIQRYREMAYADFARAEQAMLRKGERDMDLLKLLNAMTKMAGREFQAAQRGEPGAIADLKELVRRGFRVETCGGLLAQCYFTLGLDAYLREAWAEAHKYWEEAYRWAPDAYMKRLIRNNQAGAYQADNAFDSAEALIREQTRLEPDIPDHWKNLGLILGFQGRLKEALDAYARARDLCAQRSGSFFIGVLHGNAWLRAAMIHAILLTEDGSLPESWRLLLEYRRMFGDDYNFCLAFADVAYHLERYELAARYYERARLMQPRCKQAYQRLVELAMRLPGTPEERKARLEAARADYAAVKARYDDRQEDPNVLRMCNGTRDLIDGGQFLGIAAPLDPDPLAGADPSAPPPWFVEAAKSRRPFAPFRPGIDGRPATSGPASNAGVPGEGPGGGTPLWWFFVGGGLLATGASYLALRRLRPRSA